MVSFNMVDASSVDFDQAGNKIGGFIEIYADGAKWLVVHHGANTLGTNA